MITEFFSNRARYFWLFKNKEKRLLEAKINNFTLRKKLLDIFLVPLNCRNLKLKNNGLRYFSAYVIQNVQIPDKFSKLINK